ncbi:MAG: hypothetical protein U0S50_10570 [Sphingopyxis sp.]|uniref:hypothetical protein n=1 Tax=Sphingopyxis sp. TaxID=1908224 RepID=UPI002AB999AD|nr:hypothetical protein [Sphingopyxis sp.]MDZ3832249.1 hypothetical protein [Sphingopyxis sp.]
MRLPTYIYGLIYPAFLGSFLFGALAAPFPDNMHVWAALLMILYFSAQYGEGAVIANNPDLGIAAQYGRSEAAIDLGEILAMVAIMAAIGIFGDAPSGLVGRLFDPASRFDHWGWMALAFALPPLGRVLLSFWGRHPDRRSHDVKAHGRLTALSLSAAVGSLLGYIAPALGLGVISASLMTYLVLLLGRPDIGEAPVHETLSRHRRT